MSVLASSWVWRYAQAGGTALIVLLAIADHADDDGVAWPSIATLAGKARLDGRTVQRIIRRLVDVGALELLEATAGGRRSNTYRLIMALPTTSSPDLSTPLADCHPGGLPPVAQPCRPSPGTVAPPQPRHNRATRTVIESPSNLRGAALPPPVGAERCPLHVGHLAANCGACRSLLLAGGAR